MTEQEMIAQVEERLRKEFQEKFSDMENKFNSLNEQVQTIDKFISAMAESQSFEQTMSEIESVTKQLTNCDNATFYCYDRSNDKFFSNGDYRNWLEEQSADDIKKAFESKKILSTGKEAVIPLVSSSGDSLGVIVAEKEGGFTPDDYNNFRQGCPLVNTAGLALKKEFEYQEGHIDELTRLKNRKGLNDYLVNTLCGNVNDGKSVSILMCDIDHFKNVNDTYGHDAGDVIIKGVADVLQEGTRSGADCAFRMGGEEMVCILNCPPEKAMDIAERLREKVENTVHHITVNNEPVDVKVTVSMGLHGMTPDLQITPENAREVFDREFKNADIAVYQAKETGRNKVVAADENVYASYLALKSAEILCSEEPENIESFQKQVKKSLDLDRFPEVTEALQAYAEEHPEVSAAAEKIISKLVDLSQTYVKEEREMEDFDLSQLYDEEEIEMEENTMNEQEGKEPTYFNKDSFRNIQNKEYINTDSKTAYLISLKAQEQGIEHSVKYDGKQSAVTVDGVRDKAFIEAVRKEFNIPENSRPEKAAEKPAPEQSKSEDTQKKAPTYFNKEGYKDIQNKTFLQTDSRTAYAISKNATEKGIAHSVKYDGEKSAVTVDGVKDKAFVEAVRKEFNILEKTAEKPAPEQSKNEDVQKKAPTFFNKEGYKDIQNKTFLQTDSRTAYAISKEAQKQGVKHSVKYDGDKSTVTLDGIADRPFINTVVNRAFKDTVKNMSDWAGKVQEKAIKEQAKENQQKNNDAR